MISTAERWGGIPSSASEAVNSQMPFARKTSGESVPLSILLQQHITDEVLLELAVVER